MKIQYNTFNQIYDLKLTATIITCQKYPNNDEHIIRTKTRQIFDLTNPIQNVIRGINTELSNNHPLYHEKKY